MNFLSNINYLLHNKLKKKFSILEKQSDFEHLLDNLKYELYEDINNIQIPNIKNVDETIDILLNENCSICRFGDGEFLLMDNKSIPFQKASDILRKRLIDIFTSNHKNIRIAIQYYLYHSKTNLTDITKSFWRNRGPEFRKFLNNYLNMKKEYLSSEVSLAYTFFKDYDFDNYFSKLRCIWNNKNIIIVCGNTVFDNIEYNLFDNACSIKYIYVPSINAFDSYENILENIKKEDISYLIILICGPTAKVLAYDLSLSGYRALDLGHIAKSYDFYRKNIKINTFQKSHTFFSPD